MKPTRVIPVHYVLCCSTKMKYSCLVFILISAVVLTNGAFCGDPAPNYPEITPDTVLHTHFLSVTSLGEEPFHGVDQLPVMAPVNATVTQIMLLAQEYTRGDFWFESHFDPTYGTLVSGINGLYNNYPWYWFLYDIMEDGMTACGTDYTHARPNDHFHWLYEEYIPQY
ncbi:hypothetical protein BSL78_11342 [Apostichopus japonicus]|uniref:DUF4430 domain-containing protein n=1 Tax=Stichopus japonicus TaxID=307972 RepID=A0A2G8KUV4_STIJA|nr:hypothetical protein BSL78_11342 [Apostichopus japonicus]